MRRDCVASTESGNDLLPCFGSRGPEWWKKALLEALSLLKPWNWPECLVCLPHLIYPMHFPEVPAPKDCCPMPMLALAQAWTNMSGFARCRDGSPRFVNFVIHALGAS